MHRALLQGGEGIAAQNLYALFVGDRRLTGDTKLQAWAACGALAILQRRLLGG